MRALVFALALMITAGCARPAPSPPAAEVGSVNQVVAALERQERGTDTLTALFRLIVRRTEQTESMRGALVVARPDRLRLQIFSLGVMTVYDYTANGDRFRIRLPLAGETRTGSLSSADGHAPPAYDLRPLFLREGDFDRARVEEEAETWLVVVEADGSLRELRVSKTNGTVAAENVSAAGQPLLRARYGDYRLVDGLPLPFRIEVEYPARDTKLEIDVSRYTRNQPVEESLFVF